ncbi:hypothetical protein OBBRIDRAFT_805101 [Obba rivulosa]|uniref:Uncharacterized protein n=1 Tax=Obba rivulosa TaxID=1052685 RepID=A0A8E2B0G4_9APHY|nr:hypothetical protein OBBRIDRAFT_805101 [Obba rivulosa]
MISPCINILRQLVTQINGTLGSKQGSRHHTPELEKDILKLRRSMREHNIYQVERGRTIDYEKDDERAAMPNIVSGSSHETGCMVAEQHRDKMGASIEEDDENMVSDEDKDIEMEMGEWDNTRIDELLALETEEDVALDIDNF